MDFFRDSLLSALLLIRTLDAELIEIVLTSLRVSIAATLIASAIGASLGFSIAIVRFPGKRVFVTLLNTLLALRISIPSCFSPACHGRRRMGPVDGGYRRSPECSDEGFGVATVGLRRGRCGGRPLSGRRGPSDMIWIRVPFRPGEPAISGQQ